MAENMRIKSTMLGREDHGILTAFLNLEGNGCGQEFGGWSLDSAGSPDAAAGFWISRVLEVVGANEWEGLPGKYVRVVRDRGLIVGIGHITENRWFHPRAEMLALESSLSVSLPDARHDTDVERD